MKKMHVCKSLTNDSMSTVKAQVLASVKNINYKVYVGVLDCGEIAVTVLLVSTVSEIILQIPHV